MQSSRSVLDMRKCDLAQRCLSENSRQALPHPPRSRRPCLVTETVYMGDRAFLASESRVSSATLLFRRQVSLLGKTLWHRNARPRPKPRCFDARRSCSTTSLYRNILCRRKPASPRGGAWRVIAPFSPISASPTFGRITPFSTPLDAQNRPSGLSFSESFGLVANPSVGRESSVYAGLSILDFLGVRFGHADHSALRTPVRWVSVSPSRKWTCSSCSRFASALASKSPQPHWTSPSGCPVRSGISQCFYRRGASCSASMLRAREHAAQLSRRQSRPPGSLASSERPASTMWLCLTRRDRPDPTLPSRS